MLGGFEKAQLALLRVTRMVGMGAVLFRTLDARKTAGAVLRELRGAD